MTHFQPLVRIAAIAGLIAATGVAVAPAFAGPAEMALLKSYEGSWKGKGQVVGADTETVTCRMLLSAGNDDKVNYSGRCALAGSPTAGRAWIIADLCPSSLPPCGALF